MANGKRYKSAWDKTMALVKLRKQGFRLPACAQRMSLPLAEVEAVYLAGLARGGVIRDRMRVDNAAYVARWNK